MKPTNFLFTGIVLFLLSSCNNTNEPIYRTQNVDQLKTVIGPFQKDNDILPCESRLYIINSVEDIYNTQTERFIEENPEWLEVDFTTKSIIANRDLLLAFNYWKSSRVVSFSQYIDDSTFESMGKKGDYRLVIENTYTRHDVVDENDESQYRIIQTAFVTEKIPSDATIWIDVKDRVDP